MRINIGGVIDFNQLFSDADVTRNEDIPVEQADVFQGGSSLSGVAAQFAHAQLFNPVGSGIETYVDQIIFATTATSAWSLRTFATELTTDDGAWSNRRLGTVAGLSHVRQQNNAAALGTRIFPFRLLANTLYILRFKFPFLVVEGQGLVLLVETANIGMTAGFFGREI